MSEAVGLDILSFMVSKPEIVWMLALMGAVCVIGVVDYLRCFFEGKKKAIRWVVLFLSLFVAIVLSPIIPPFITVIVILWLLILALATIGKKAIIDGIPLLVNTVINKLMGNSRNIDGGK
jgi:hypothetical protein